MLYIPTYDFEDYNGEYKNYTNCYAYAFGMQTNPVTGEKFPRGGNQPGLLSNDEYCAFHIIKLMEALEMQTLIRKNFSIILLCLGPCACSSNEIKDNAQILFFITRIMLVTIIHGNLRKSFCLE